MSTRDKKGQSLLDVINKYVVVDLETTGLDPQYDAIIEICALKVANGEVVDKFTSLVKPPYSIPSFITALTGITNEMVENAPPIEDVLPKFVEFACDSILIAHNANFDINFLYDNLLSCMDYCLSNNFLCTMRLSRRLYKQYKSHRLMSLATNFGFGELPQHRAESDCIITHKCYEYMKNHITTNNIDLQELLKKQSQSLKAKDIAATYTEFDESHPLYNQVCVFTGALEMLRKEAMQLVVNVGGTCSDNVTPDTNFLILGNNDYCKLIKDGKSSKQKKAEELILKGYDITILSEKVFMDLLRDSQVSQDINIKARKEKTPVNIKQEKEKPENNNGGISIGVDLSKFNIKLDNIREHSTMRCSVCNRADWDSIRSDWDTNENICGKCFDKKFSGHFLAEYEYRKAYKLEKVDLQKAIVIYETLALNQEFRNLWAHDRLIVIYKKIKQYDDAIRICRMAVDSREKLIQIDSTRTVWPLFNGYKLELAKLRYKTESTDENLKELNYQKEKEAEYIIKKNLKAEEMRRA